MNVVVFGFKNCGKGFVGKALAKEMKWDFVDTDNVVEEIYFEREGRRLSFRQIAKERGMDFFKGLEKEAVKRVSAVDGRVIALGGGTPLFFDNTQVLKKNGKMVLLRLGKETLFKRIMDCGVPAFFDPKDPRGSFEKLFRERMEKFREIADFEVNCDNKSDKQIAGEIMRLVGKA